MQDFQEVASLFWPDIANSSKFLKLLVDVDEAMSASAMLGARYNRPQCLGSLSTRTHACAARRRESQRSIKLRTRRGTSDAWSSFTKDHPPNAAARSSFSGSV
jgi:hypothetical protein